MLGDFWDCTCVNFLQTLPYVAVWHRQYAPLRLTVVGAHNPEFAFAKELDDVKHGIETTGITYPVVMDSGFAIWRAYANRYWLAEYLIDKGDGHIRYCHHGEGAYKETELPVQTLPREIRVPGPGVAAKGRRHARSCVLPRHA